MSKRILLVDDSSVMRKLVTRAIRQTGLDVEVVAEAGNGKEALTALRSQPIDLVFCDWNMPEMNGLEFVVEARKSHQTPIVMLTTEGTSDKSQEALSAGANAYLTKPFTPESLMAKMRVLLGV
ncbi:MAG: response regulator [Planctomycetes bacterium]|nr:response regulator [Planctomycetota bacterium]